MRYGAAVRWTPGRMAGCFCLALSLAIPSAVLPDPAIGDTWVQPDGSPLSNVYRGSISSGVPFVYNQRWSRPRWSG